MIRAHTYITAVCTTCLLACGGSLGGSGGGTDGPCDLPNPPPVCAAECGADAPCPTGFHCGSDGTCTADCTAGGGECPAGQRCDGDGRCIPDETSGIDANPCPDVSVRVSAVVPTVVLLIDQSGSMNESFGGTTRWEALKTALIAPDIGVIARLAEQVIFGATLYTSRGGNRGGTCPMLEEVAPALNNYPAINGLLTENEPVNDTPTSEAIEVVARTFPGIDPDHPTPNIMVLATDGAPDNCVDADAHDEATQAMSEASVVAAFDLGVVTYVLSVGDDVAEPHLQKLANAGVGEPLDTGTATYYVASNPEELIAAFSEIIGGVRTCTFTLDAALDLVDAPLGVVELNGVALDYGTQWTMVDETTLELLGDTCTEFLNATDAVLTAEFPCGVIVD